MSYQQKEPISFERRQYSGCLACSGELKTVFHKIRTPILWISYEFYSPKGLWRHVKNIEGMLVNVHNIEDRKGLLRRLFRHQDLRAIMEFQGHLMLDCGGIKFARGNKDLLIDRTLRLVKKVNPDIMISPDYPISPYNDPEENEIRIAKTVQNLVKTLRFMRDIPVPVLPVIHGYDFSQIDRMLKRILKITGEVYLVGLGSLVPLLVPFTLDKARKVVDLILYVRKKLPSAFLHVFGMSSILTMHLAFLAGADSVDSQSWIRSAGYGKLQVPGCGQLFVKKNKKYKYKQWSKEIPTDFKCNCPICLEKGEKSLVDSKRFRAIHNAYVLCSEANLVTRMVEQGEYVDFVKQRLKNTRLFNLFKHIQSNDRM